MKYLLFGVTIFLLNACSKEDFTSYSATLQNKTMHSILILPYKSGVVLSADTIKLTANSEFQIANGVQWGIVTVPGFSSKYAGGPNDSMVVIFDGLYKVSHYANTPSQLSNKYYLFGSTRNILNPYSYSFETMRINKHHQKNNHVYEFTEQDYLYSQ